MGVEWYAVFVASVELCYGIVENMLWKGDIFKGFDFIAMDLFKRRTVGVKERLSITSGFVEYKVKVRVYKDGPE
jgi:hypothetical protein